jgi:hypothetical protein
MGYEGSTRIQNTPLSVKAAMACAGMSSDGMLEVTSTAFAMLHRKATGVRRCAACMSLRINTFGMCWENLSCSLHAILQWNGLKTYLAGKSAVSFLDVVRLP